jgi:hypothetical protein
MGGEKLKNFEINKGGPKSFRNKSQNEVGVLDFILAILLIKVYNNRTPSFLRFI